ncbi:FtsK/SpoIIIE domain-containing protein [Actinophytocola sp.]|uniref:FtsK/SpoIIIE domain-containing protein n=1 Tax=Actinophytocola sp. TaxID=1872138 RepID=UPI002ED4C9CF
MKIKFTFQRPGGAVVDLQATVDAATTVGDLAAQLVRADPHGQGAAADGTTLSVVSTDRRALDPALRVADSGLHSGATVALARGGRAFADPQAPPAATVRITAGPDRGREFGLAWGTAVIGRDAGCEVRLADPLVSRRHARLNITDVAEIVDLGSANGTQLGGSVVARTALRAGDVVRVGDTELTVHIAPAHPGAGNPGAFVRSPRLDPRYAGVELTAPEPPQRGQHTRFPIVSLLAPLLMGGVLYLMTRSLVSLVFVALTPLMLVGNTVEAKLAGRSSFRKAVRQFRADLDDLAGQARSAATDEVTARQREHPSLTDCADAVRGRGSLLWTRRPGEHGFLELRLGLGRRPSRNTIELPDGRRSPRNLTAELRAVTDEFTTVDQVPVVAQPAEHGAVGVAGPRAALLDTARALVMQLVSLHSPAEMVLAGFASAQSSAAWDWLKWLPHTTSPHSPLPVRHLADNGASAGVLVAELEGLLVARESGDAALLPAVFVLVEDDAPVERSRLVDLAERGAGHGVHVLWLAPEVARLPAACRHFVSVDHGPTGEVGLAHVGERVEPVLLETLDATAALELARRLAPLVDTGARVDDDSDLPRTVSLLAVPERPIVAAPEAVIEQWAANRSIVTGPYAPERPDRRPGTLRAVVGASASGVLALDLRADGPHALVGGTTGSGKSELLQAWILAMALAHSPQRLTFLLVDYKGGAAFKEFTTLPHNVGMVTDLDPHLVRRVLASLHAELLRREHLFHQHNVKDLAELERKAPTDAPPSLVIVVDEFAALVSELPEFVDGVVNVAQRGRSLGVHLILATQRPAGVIRENLRANTNLRIALRTADESDSTDVLGTPQAAFIDVATPGRAIAKTGPGRLVPFQAGYAGGWTSEQAPPPEIVLEELRFGAGRAWEFEVSEEVGADPGPTDITRLVTAIAGATRKAAIPPPRRPWLPELCGSYDLSDRSLVRTGRRDDALVFGIRDDPKSQTQPPVEFVPDTDGNLAVYGTGGSGKSTLLRTLAITAGFTVHGGPCHVYGMDFGARGLDMLSGLPHVGSVVAGADHERIIRLITRLRDLVDERALRYSQVNAGTIGEYREKAGAPDEPRVLLLLDGVAAFRQAYEASDRSRWFDILVGVANDGRPVGVHLLLSADRPTAVPSALASAIQTRVTLRMADTNDYALLGVPTDVLRASSPPGRGLLRGAEIQVAMLGSQPDVGSQAVAIRRFGAAMERAGGTVAPPVLRLEDKIRQCSLPDEIDGLPVLGVGSAELAPHTFDPRGAFLVMGPPVSGRTTALHALAVALRRWRPDMPLHYFGSKRSRLATLPLWTSPACGIDEIADHARELTEKLAGPAALFVENLANLHTTAADLPLATLVRQCLEQDLFVVGEGETSTLGVGGQGLIGTLRAGRQGLALAPATDDGLTVMRTPFPPRLNRADFPPGRALHVVAGRTAVVQIALPEEDHRPAAPGPARAGVAPLRKG